MDQQLLNRIKRYIEQRASTGDTVTISGLAFRFNITQKALLLALMNLETGMEFNMGYADENGKWQDYGSIGEYTVVAYSDFDLLKRVLARCRGQHPQEAVNRQMEELWTKI